ncbi:3-hydroxyisobutyryl-CoA hydrolase-like protein 1 [Striga asiatica]|uniref:3-hydroxyisobutyryl-CoA hydrolase-like protein 1 n=1 Tax=Striga asiatica TaxID=4170 RepID=A0A5A7QMS6_STRAF|nr:3-hydroxyisobutyryl-CoA hydrolase-like protein 1 [Striga asiatica]
MSDTGGESPVENTIGHPSKGNIPISSGPIDWSIHWTDYAVQQAKIAQKTVENTVENAIEITRSRVDRMLTTSSAHFNQTMLYCWDPFIFLRPRVLDAFLANLREGTTPQILCMDNLVEMGKMDSLQDLKSEYITYEDIVFGKIKEGFLYAYSRPLITTGAVLGVGFFGLKRTRQFLSYSTRRLFFSEETLLARADAKVQNLQESIDVLKAESVKLEKAALQAEEDLVRGRTKLRQAGKQIQGVINSAYKIERQARGLKDVLSELPSIEASRFRRQVKNLAKEAKKERNAIEQAYGALTNYGGFDDDTWRYEMRGVMGLERFVIIWSGQSNVPRGGSCDEFHGHSLYHYDYETQEWIQKLLSAEKKLGNLAFSGDPSAIDDCLSSFEDRVRLDQTSVLHRIETVDKCFGHGTVEEIIESLENEAAKTNDLWCVSTLQKLKEAAPWSLKVSLRSWEPPSLEHVSQDMVDQYFSALSPFEPDLELNIMESPEFTQVPLKKCSASSF